MKHWVLRQSVTIKFSSETQRMAAIPHARVFLFVRVRNDEKVIHFVNRNSRTSRQKEKCKKMYQRAGARRRFAGTVFPTGATAYIDFDESTI